MSASKHRRGEISSAWINSVRPTSRRDTWSPCPAGQWAADSDPAGSWCGRSQFEARLGPGDTL